MTKVKLKILDKDLYCNKSNLPKYETERSAGMDLRSTKDIVLLSNTTCLLGTGLAIYIDNPLICATILPRSGLGHKYGLVLGNLIGLIDSDYQGELKISVWNRSNHTNYFSRGDRIAQLVFLPILRASFVLVDSFEQTNRNSGGFGHSGVL